MLSTKSRRQILQHQLIDERASDMTMTMAQQLLHTRPTGQGRAGRLLQCTYSEIDSEPNYNIKIGRSHRAFAACS